MTIKPLHLAIALAVGGLVIYVARRKASAPAAQSTTGSKVTGVVGGLVSAYESWTASPPGVPPSSNPTEGTTPHGTSLTDTDFVYGSQVDGVGPTPQGFNDYSQAVLAGAGPTGLYAVS